MRSNGGGDAPEDDLGADLGRHARGRHADDNGVVAREHQVDHDNVEKGDAVLTVPVDAQQMSGFLAEKAQARRQFVRQPVHEQGPSFAPCETPKSYVASARQRGKLKH
jgi:hypothetical protein